MRFRPTSIGGEAGDGLSQRTQGPFVDRAVRNMGMGVRRASAPQRGAIGLCGDEKAEDRRGRTRAGKWTHGNLSRQRGGCQRIPRAQGRRGRLATQGCRDGCGGYAGRRAPGRSGVPRRRSCRPATGAVGPSDAGDPARAAAAPSSRRACGLCRWRSPPRPPPCSASDRSSCSATCSPPSAGGQDSGLPGLPALRLTTVDADAQGTS